jgi:hypothetical protein
MHAIIPKYLIKQPSFDHTVVLSVAKAVQLEIQGVFQGLRFEGEV